MSGSRSTGAGVFETMEGFYKRRQREVANFGREAEAAAHGAYGEAIRTGRDLALRTQEEVNRFGAKLLADGPPKRANSTRQPSPGTGTKRPARPPMRTPQSVVRSAVQGPADQRSVVRQGVDQALAFGRGAQDALTIGMGDRVYAGSRALIDASKGADLGGAWQSRMAAERARDQYDAKNFKVARAAGEITGTGLGLVALGPVDAALAGGVRIAQAAPMVAREAAVLAGVGAGGGMVSQATTDLQNRKFGSVGDYAGSAIGGATMALAMSRGRAGQAGAVGGATTSVAQDVLNGRSVDWEGASRTALAGGHVAAPFGFAGRRYSDGLSAAEKGKLGEALGRVRSRVNGEVPIGGGKRLLVDGGRRYTVLDQETASGLMSEQKFGRSIRGLSRNQQAAFNENPGRYRVDHFLPRDVGAAFALPFGLLGSQQALDKDR